MSGAELLAAWQSRKDRQERKMAELEALGRDLKSLPLQEAMRRLDEWNEANQ